MTSTRPRRRAWAAIVLTAVLAIGVARAGGSPAGAPVYRVVGLVLEQVGPVEGAHGPQLCLGAIAAIYPPRCTGIAVAGWDWAAVQGEQSAAGTTQGRYVVTGTFVRVVRNVATHRVELRRRFRGNLCVTQSGWSERASGRILNRAIAAVPQANRLGGGTDIVNSHVDIDVVLDTGKLQRTFDTRFGRGLVRVHSALRRVA